MSGGICLFTLNSSSVNNTRIAVGKPASSDLLKNILFINGGSDSIVCVCVGGGGIFIFNLGRDVFFWGGG